MKVRQASHILGIKLVQDHSKRMLGLSQITYINIVLTRISMHNSKKGFVPFRFGKILLGYQHFKTHADKYFAMLSIQLEICFAMGM